MGFGIYVFLLVIVGYEVIDCSGLVHPLSMRSPTHFSRKQDSMLEYETHYYTQILDHFTFVPEGSRTFQQRYYVNKAYWGGPQSNSPIFVFIGEEDNLAIRMSGGGCGLLTENAPKFKALLLFIEHRYYGESVPDIVGNPSNPVVNRSTFGYLTSEQALADYATLITDFKKNLSAENSPVVAFGGSYGGMLSAWLRLKYPHITIGALSSSAPILFFHNVTPDYAFYAVVTKNFRDVSESCYSTIKNMWIEIDSLASQTGGYQKISKIFNTCQNLTDLTQFRRSLIAIFQGVAQYDLPAIKDICHGIDSAPEGSDDMNRVAAGITYVNSGCLEVDDTNPNQFNRFNPWKWQTCTEMVFPLGRDPIKTMFPLQPFDLNAYAERCKSNYGVVPRPNWVTIEYVVADMRKALKHFGSNIVFSNGLRDPWSAGGVVENITESIVAVNTEEGIHCQDLHASSPNDPEWLKEQRSKEFEFIKSWIEQYNTDFLNK